MRIEKITAKRHCIATAKSLHSFCSAAARPLQYDCNRIAELLQASCSDTAKSVQNFAVRKELITKIIAPMKEVCSTIEMETKWA